MIKSIFKAIFLVTIFCILAFSIFSVVEVTFKLKIILIIVMLIAYLVFLSLIQLLIERGIRKVNYLNSSENNQGPYITTLPRYDLFEDENYNPQIEELYSMIYGNKRVQNIGVIGGLGVGKTSVIESTLMKRKLGVKNLDNNKSGFIKHLCCIYFRIKRMIFQKQYTVFRIAFSKIDDRTSYLFNENKKLLKYLEICTMQIESQVKAIKIRQRFILCVCALIMVVPFFFINDYITTLSKNDYFIECQLTTYNEIGIFENYTNNFLLINDVTTGGELCDVNSVNPIRNLAYIYYLSFANILLFLIIIVPYLVVRLLNSFKIAKVTLPKIAGFERELDSLSVNQLELNAMKKLLMMFDYLSLNDNIVIIEDVDRNSNVSLLLTYLKLINKMLNARYNEKNNTIKRNFKFIYAIKLDGTDSTSEEITKLFEAAVYVYPAFSKHNIHRLFNEIDSTHMKKCNDYIVRGLCYYVKSVREMKLVIQEFHKMCKNIQFLGENKYNKFLFYSILKVCYPDLYTNLDECSLFCFLEEGLGNESTDDENEKKVKEYEKLKEKFKSSYIIHYGKRNKLINSTGEHKFLTTNSKYNRIDIYMFLVNEYNRSSNVLINDYYNDEFSEEECREIVSSLSGGQILALNDIGINFSVLNYIYKNTTVVDSEFSRNLKSKLYYSIINFSDARCVSYFEKYIKNSSDEEVKIIVSDFHEWLKNEFINIYAKDGNIKKLHNEICTLLEGVADFGHFAEEYSKITPNTIIENINLISTEDSQNKKNNAFIVAKIFENEATNEILTFKLDDTFNNRVQLIKTLCEDDSDLLYGIKSPESALDFSLANPSRYSLLLCADFVNKHKNSEKNINDIIYNKRDEMLKSEFEEVVEKAYDRYERCCFDDTINYKANTCVKNLEDYYKNSFGTEKRSGNELIISLINEIDICKLRSTSDSKFERFCNLIFSDYVKVNSNSNGSGIQDYKSAFISFVKTVQEPNEVVDVKLNPEDLTNALRPFIEFKFSLKEDDSPKSHVLLGVYGPKKEEKVYNKDYYDNLEKLVDDVVEFAIYLKLIIDNLKSDEASTQILERVGLNNY